MHGQLRIPAIQLAQMYFFIAFWSCDSLISDGKIKERKYQSYKEIRKKLMTFVKLVGTMRALLYLITMTTPQDIVPFTQAVFGALLSLRNVSPPD